MDKMLVSPTNDIIITNDGVTILDEMRIEHPAAKMMVEIAKTQESEVGDGTTTAVMIAGKLLENAEKLLDLKIHPTVITKGYRLAAEKAKEILLDIALKISPEDEDILKQIAMTAMKGKGTKEVKEEAQEVLEWSPLMWDEWLALDDETLRKSIEYATQRMRMDASPHIDKYHSLSE